MARTKAAVPPATSAAQGGGGAGEETENKPSVTDEPTGEQPGADVENAADGSLANEGAQQDGEPETTSETADATAPELTATDTQERTFPAVLEVTNNTPSDMYLERVFVGAYKTERVEFESEAQLQKLLNAADERAALAGWTEPVTVKDVEK
jgi:hypothetical protein